MYFFLRKSGFLRLRTGAFLLCFFLLTGSGGCVFVAGGIVGAAGGYMLARDTIAGEYQVKYKDAWKVCLDACSSMGEVNEQSYDDGVIMATIDRVDVKVTVSELSEKLTGIKVKARKALFPQIGTAEKVFVRIAQKLTH